MRASPAFRRACRASMTIIWPAEFVILQRSPTSISRITCRAASIPTGAASRPMRNRRSRAYSIGQWLDTDGDGRYDTLEAETRNLKARAPTRRPDFRCTRTTRRRQGAHRARTKSNPDILVNEITTSTRATAPGRLNQEVSPRAHTSSGSRTSAPKQCARRHRQGEYMLSADGLLMPGALRRRRRGPAAISSRPAMKASLKIPLQGA